MDVRIAAQRFFKVDEDKRKKWLRKLEIARKQELLDEPNLEELGVKTKQEGDEMTLRMLFVLALQSGLLHLEKCYYTSVDEEYAMQNYKKEDIFILGLTDDSEVVFSFAPIQKIEKIVTGTKVITRTNKTYIY